jgi:hypothetical protein
MADEGRLPVSLLLLHEWRFNYTEDALLKIKLYVMGYTSSNDYWGSQIPRLINYGLHKRLTVRSIKLIADGALGSWGAALIAPYNDRPDTRGLLRASPETLHKLAERFYEDHFQVVRIFLVLQYFIPFSRERTNPAVDDA